MKGIFELSDDPNPPLKIPNIGTVIVEDHVEIGSNACIDRATMGATVIGTHSKIDDLVMIAHNVRVGREVMVIAGTAVGGSSTLCDRAILAGQVGIPDHVRVGKDAILQGQTGAIGDLEDGVVVVGSPPVPVKDKFLHVAHTKKLPQLFKDFRAMQKRVEQLEKLLADKLEPAITK
jgi:UDP-3-O-[3-hydroxymyristoyl] glucosamine N-acyltransferase